MRIAVAAAAPLLADEAYYWLWSRRLDWSYLDHPPMIAYLVRLSTVAGDAQFWVRLPALVLGVATAWGLYRLGQEMFSERVGFLAALLYQVTPVLGGTGVFSTPDAPLSLAWVSAMLLVWQALRGRPWRWAGAGVALGLGLLSKLYLPLLAAGIVLYLWAREPGWLRRPHPYAAAGIAAALFAPVLYWNWTHGWAAVRFVVAERAEPGGVVGSLGWLRLAENHLPLVLLLFPAFVWAAAAAWRRRADARFAYLLTASVPALVLPVLVAPLGAARGHLAAPGYLGLAVILAALWSRAVSWLALANALLLGVFVMLLLVPGLPPVPGAREYYGWQEVGLRVAEEARALGPEAVLVADRFQMAAQLAYHTRGTLPVLVLPPQNPASIWPRPEPHAGSPAVAVTYAPDPPRAGECFASAEELPSVRVILRGRPLQQFRVFRLFGLDPRCTRRRVNRTL
ncbi:MAG: glycosyltransferase family 39 protein [Armatimonadota bacterium]|nr:glycosyltransferase family 39 protein [Armatimonadota bacterium]